MKILLLIESLGSGGAERQLVGLASQLKIMGNNVFVVTYEHKDFYASTLIKNGINYKEVAVGKSIFTRVFAIWKCIRGFNPCFIISFSRASSIIACALKLFNKKSNVLVSERNTTQVLSFSEKLKFFLYRYSDIIVPNSYSQETFIKKNYPRLANKCVVINNFVDIDVFNTPKNRTIDLNRILVVARVSQQKNVLGFIKALATIKKYNPELTVDWYGDQSDEPYYNNCVSFINNNNLSESFHFHKPATNINKIYRDYSVFCLPSYYEGYPNVVCEAMSSGLVILCSDVCDNSRIVKSGENGFLFDPRNEQSIVDAFNCLFAQKPDEIRRIMSHNREQMVLNNSIESFTQKYLDTLSQVQKNK